MLKKNLHSQITVPKYTKMCTICDRCLAGHCLVNIAKYCKKTGYLTRYCASSLAIYTIQRLCVKIFSLSYRILSHMGVMLL